MVGLGALRFLSVGICFCGVCGVNSNSVGLIVLSFLDFSCCADERSKLLIQDVGSYA